MELCLVEFTGENAGLYEIKFFIEKYFPCAEAQLLSQLPEEKAKEKEKKEESKYASATVVVRKKDEEGNYTDFRQCGDYRPCKDA